MIKINVFFIINLFITHGVIAQCKLFIKQVFEKNDTVPELIVANYEDSCLKRINDSTLTFTCYPLEPQRVFIIINDNIRPRWITKIWIIPETANNELIINYSNKTVTINNITDWDKIINTIDSLQAKENFTDAFNFVSDYIKREHDSYLSLWFFTHSHPLYIQSQNKKLALFKELDPLLQKYPLYRQTNADLLNRKYPSQGDPFKEFSLPGKNDSLINSAVIKNKWILLHFWGNFCSPCIKEIDSLIHLYNSIDTSKVTFISVSLDENYNVWKMMKTTSDLKWINVWQPDNWYSDLCLNYNVNTVPFYIIFNKEKKIHLISNGTEFKLIKSTLLPIR